MDNFLNKYFPAGRYWPVKWLWEHWKLFQFPVIQGINCLDQCLTAELRCIRTSLQLDNSQFPWIHTPRVAVMTVASQPMRWEEGEPETACLDLESWLCFRNSSWQHITAFTVVIKKVTHHLLDRDLDIINAKSLNWQDKSSCKEDARSADGADLTSLSPAAPGCPHPALSAWQQ